jgi:hypothetical protein
MNCSTTVRATARCCVVHHEPHDDGEMALVGRNRFSHFRKVGVEVVDLGDIRRDGVDMIDKALADMWRRPDPCVDGAERPAKIV